MAIAVVFLCIGFLLIFLEFFLPGAIMGIIGSLVVLTSIFLFALSAPSPLWTVVYVVGVLIALIFLVRFSIWKVSHSSPDFSVFSNNNQEGYYASRYDKTTIGKNGQVLTDLRPGGYILIEGKKYSAISKSGYIPKGAKVKVISGEEESLIVQGVNENGT